MNKDEVDTAISMSTDHIVVVKEDTNNPQVQQQKLTPPHVQQRILWLIFLLGLSLFVFVVIPIIVKLPYYTEPWLTVGDVWKMLDPLFTLPIWYFILTNAQMYRLKQESKALFSFSKPRCLYMTQRTFIKLIFLIGVAFYIEGHGIHTAATVFKDPVKYAMNSSTGTTSPPLREIYSYIRDQWQHLISHYIYAIGALIMNIAHMFAYKDQIHAPLTKWHEWILFLLASILFGLLFAGVSINFPYGLIVGLVWICAFGVPWAVYLFIKQDDTIVQDKGCFNISRRYLFSSGKKLLLQFYLLSYTISLLVIFTWIGIFGFKQREEAAVPLKQ